MSHSDRLDGGEKAQNAGEETRHGDLAFPQHIDPKRRACHNLEKVVASTCSFAAHSLHKFVGGALARRSLVKEEVGVSGSSFFSTAIMR